MQERTTHIAMQEKKKILIFGGGSKFGLELAKSFASLNHEVSIVTSAGSSETNFKTHVVDWSKLDITRVEKLCTSFAEFDIVIFNQNYSTINNLEDISIPKLEMWKKLKQWQQGLYINCHLPLQICNSLYVNNKINDKTKVLWILSGCISNDSFTTLEYQTQKYINHESVRYMKRLDMVKCIGLNPGKLDENNYAIKANKLSKFLETVENNNTGTFYAFDKNNEITQKQNYFL